MLKPRSHCRRSLSHRYGGIGFVLLLSSLQPNTATAAAIEEADDDYLSHPTVTITRRPGSTLEEYRYNGTLYMVKIIPDKGYPYYLIDSDGNGSFDRRINPLENPHLVQWRLWSW